MGYWLWVLRHPWRALGPRCPAASPWRLADCGPCIRPRGHEQHGGSGGDWHADGTGYIWNDLLGRWQWMGPVIGPEEYDVATYGEYRDPPSGPVFIEQQP